MVVGLGVLAVACGDEAAELPPPETSTSSTSPPTTPAPPPTTPVPTEEDQILAAVEGYWNALLRANDPPRADHPDLHRYLTGQALLTAKANIDRRVASGARIYLPPNSLANISSSLESTIDGVALVRACVVDDAIQANAESGAVISDEVTTYLTVLTVRHEDGLWRVSENDVQDQWSGATTCLNES